MGCHSQRRGKLACPVRLPYKRVLEACAWLPGLPSMRPFPLLMVLCDL